MSHECYRIFSLLFSESLCNIVNIINNQMLYQYTFYITIKFDNIINTLNHKSSVL